MAKDLERVKRRLDTMQARNDELREQIDARGEQKKALAERHGQTIGKLETHLANAKAVQAAEIAAHDLETKAMVDRRAELKQDYGDLRPVYDQLMAPSEAETE